MSLNVANVMRSCRNADENADLTGDMSRKCVLPLLKTGLKHQDLKTIDVHTMAAVINGEYDERIASCRIIDARYG